MDTLVSLGILAATGWSAYTIFADSRAESPARGSWSPVFAPSGSVYLGVAAGVTIFVLAGRLFEAKAMRSAASALRTHGGLSARACRQVRR